MGITTDFEGSGQECTGGEYDYVVKGKMIGGLPWLHTLNEYGNSRSHDLYREPDY